MVVGEVVEKEGMNALLAHPGVDLAQNVISTLTE